MKAQNLKFLAVALVAAGLVACAPSANQLKKVMEDNPDILFSVIEKNPDKFLQTVNKAAQAARQVEEDRMREEENTRREEEFKNPKAPEVAEGRAFKGDKAAPITVIEYSDYQCPFCKRGHMTMKQVLEAYPGKVRIVFKNYPIERIHPHALIASKYYEAAAMQDVEKANKLHDAIFDNQSDFSEKGEAFLKEEAKKIGLKLDKLAKDVKSEEVTKRIDADRAEAEKFGFSGTPGYLINGVSLKGAYPFEDFKAIIDRHLSGKK